MKVRVYYNLHKGCLSVQGRTKKGWRVWKHTTEIMLKDVTFSVSQAGRERVIREGRKNVHAFVVGTLVDTCSTSVRVTYNPYLYDSFVEESSKRPVYAAKAAHIVGRSITVQR